MNGNTWRVVAAAPRYRCIPDNTIIISLVLGSLLSKWVAMEPVARDVRVQIDNIQERGAVMCQ